MAQRHFFLAALGGGGRWFFVWAILFFFPGGALHAVTAIPTRDGSGISIDVDELYKVTPPAGGYPARVRIANGSTANGVWRASFQSPQWGNGLRTEFEFRVAGRTTRTFEILVPFIHGMDTGLSPQPLKGEFSGPQVLNGTITLGSSTSGGSGADDGYFLVGEKATMQVWTAITEDYNKKSAGVQGTRLDGARLPTDPRAWWGVDSAWFTGEELAALQPGQTEVLNGWVARGGRLFILGDAGAYVPGRLPKSARPDEKKGTFFYGLGSIQVLSDMDETALTKEMLDTFRKPRELLAKLNDQSGSTSKLLKDAVGPRKIPAIPLVLFTVVFAILVGPVNLFVFAGKGRRHRLFFTTPLLSLGGCALALILIFVLDGSGGTGRRLLLVQSLPDRNETLLFQQQLSRTGLLFRSGFTLEDSVSAVMKGDPHGPSGQERNYDLRIAGNTFSGGWFRNRSLATLELETVRSSRARIALVAASPPVVISSFEPSFERLFYKDADKNLWVGEGVEKGKRRELRRANDSETAAFLQTLPNAGHRVQHVVEAAFKQPGFFIAHTLDARGDAIATHRAIRWEPTPGWYFGEVTP